MKKDRVQLKSPITGRWVKVNTITGSTVAHKKTKGAYKNIIKK